MKLLSIQDVAKARNMSSSGVRLAITRGQLPAIKVPSNGGKRTYYLIRPEDAKAWTGKPHRKYGSIKKIGRGTEQAIRAIVLQELEKWTAAK